MGLVKKNNKPFLTSILDQDRKSVYRLELQGTDIIVQELHPFMYAHAH